MELMDIIDSYRRYLTTKLGTEFSHMDIFVKDVNGKEVPITRFEQQFIKFKK